MFKVNDRNTKAICEVYPKLTIKTPKGHHGRLSSHFIVNFEHISHLILMFRLLT